jgi:hypothetical protein
VNREPCPDSESLAAYFVGDRPALAAHVGSCKECEALVRNLESFDAPAKPGPEWPEISQRLQVRFDSFLESAPATRKVNTAAAAFLSFWRTPLPAYAIALALVYPAWLGFNRPRTAPTSLQNTRVVRLDETRSAQPPVAVSTADPLTLDFFIPIRDGYNYTAEILDSNRKTLAGPLMIESYDGLGRFALACPPLADRTGPFTLRISESGPGGRQFNFPF